MIYISFILLIFFIMVIGYIFFSNDTSEMNHENEVTVNGEPNSKIIVTYRGSTYDISDFVRKHPGGKQILYDNNGKDIEQLMCENEHSEHAYKLLEQYKNIK